MQNEECKMQNERRLIDADALGCFLLGKMGFNPASAEMVMNWMDEYIKKAPTVDAYTEEEVANIIQLSHQLHATNVELEKECARLKSCLNCKMRKACQRHCGKVVHDCDHWEYGDSTVDAVEVVHGRWIFKHNPITDPKRYFIRIVCSECDLHTGQVSNYCPNCGAKMDGDGNG